MLKLSFLFIFSVLLSAQDLTKYVDPFIGTGAHGHTFPGATLPNGMVQLSPDTKTTDWDWCSGYHYPDSTILGFSHTHLSGTGAADYGDILFMPSVGEPFMEPGDEHNLTNGYRSGFDRKSEVAEPGYYSVFLDKPKVKAELTVTQRTGMHKYIYPESQKSNIIIDLKHGIHDKPYLCYIKIVGNDAVEGYRISEGWAKRHTVYFYAKFNKKFTSFGICDSGMNLTKNRELSSKFLKAYIRFNTKKDEQILVKVGISHTSLEGAKINLFSENKGWNFQVIRKQAKNTWNRLLKKIIIHDENEDRKKIFYTALYHCFISPNLLNDVNGKYIGMDGKIHFANDFNMYTVFSLWDTFRALHPLINLLDDKKSNDFVRSLLEKGKEYKIMPIWELASNETGCMIGYHAVSVILDAYRKGIRKWDSKLALELMKKTANEDKNGLYFYKNMGYVPMDKDVDASSKTLEYSYNDWCISEFAKELSDYKTNEEFYERSFNYRNIFDTISGFAKGRNYSGAWKENFDPMEPFPLGQAEFTEGNAWQWTFFVPHDIQGLIDLLGSGKVLEKKLDNFFTKLSENSFYTPADMTGMIGQYAHGNEPSHHISFLYNYAGVPSKTQYYTRLILDSLYKTGRDGLCGNDDCGQLSAWYIFSSLGLYPVTPGSNHYAITSPLFKEVDLQLYNGKILNIRINKENENDIFIKSLKINKKITNSAFLEFEQIINGAFLIFELSKSQVGGWGEDKSGKYLSKLNNSKFIPSEKKWVFVPHIKEGKQFFLENTIISFDSYSFGSELFYKYSDSESDFIKYTSPLIINDSKKILIKSVLKDKRESEVVEYDFYKSVFVDTLFGLKPNQAPVITFGSLPNKSYSGLGEYNLLNGKLASRSFFDKNWSGWQGKDMDILIDLKSNQKLKKIILRFLQNQGSWIFLPQEIELNYSLDGINFSNILKLTNPITENDSVKIYTFSTGKLDLNLRYLKVLAKNIGRCPPWHYGTGEAFIFSDEIILER